MTRLALLPILTVLTLGYALPALAVERLKEAEGLPYSLDLPAKMDAKLEPERSEGAMAAAVLLPHDVVGLDVLALNWPSKSKPIEIAIGRTGKVQSKAPSQPYSALTVRVGDGDPHLLFGPTPRAGIVNQLAIWARQDGSGLVLLLSLAGGDTGDSPIYAFAISSDGNVREISTGGAASAYGGFEAVDLDDDHNFELITSRNLDGMAGGFSYHAVRTLDGDSYSPKPEQFKPYFQAELAFLDWIVATREQIESDPEQFMNKGLYGFIYAAPYQNQLFGFDSIVEIPQIPGKTDRTEYNRLRREAYEKVVSYRDELQRWLGGGPRPATWKLPG